MAAGVVGRPVASPAAISRWGKGFHGMSGAEWLVFKVKVELSAVVGPSGGLRQGGARGGAGLLPGLASRGAAAGENGWT